MNAVLPILVAVLLLAVSAACISGGSVDNSAHAQTPELRIGGFKAVEPGTETELPEYTNLETVTFLVKFNRAIDPATFTYDDVKFSSGSGTVRDDEIMHVSDNSKFTFELTDMSEGVLSLYILTGAVADTGGATNINFKSAGTIKIDHTRPEPQLTSTSEGPASDNPIGFSVDFGEPINTATFTAEDISSSSGTLILHDINHRQAFGFTINGADEGTLTVDIPADRVQDPAGNNNTASNTLAIEVDRTPPGSCPPRTAPAPATLR